MREIHGPIKNGDGRWRIRTNEETQGEHKVFPCFLVMFVIREILYAHPVDLLF